MKNYFRITAYHPETDTCAILDSYGKFEKLWQFSSYLVSKGFKIVEVGNDEKFTDGNIQRISPDNKHLFLRACAKGKPNLNNNIVKINNIQYTVL